MFKFVCSRPELLAQFLKDGYKPEVYLCSVDNPSNEWKGLWEVVSKNNDSSMAIMLLNYLTHSEMPLEEKESMFKTAYRIIRRNKDPILIKLVLKHSTMVDYIKYDDLLSAIDPDDYIHHLQLLLEWKGPNGEIFKDVELLNRVFISETTYGTLEKGQIEYLLKWRGPNGEQVDPTSDSNKASIMACYEYSGDVEFTVRKLDLLSKWRGPNGEFVDFRSHNNCAFRYACIFGWHNENHKSKLIKFLLEWRGPNGEFVDLRNDKEPIIEYIFSGNRFNTTKCLRDIIEWVGPNGETIDMRGKINCYFNNPVVVNSLLKWRSSEGKFFDPTEKNHYLIKNTDQETIPYLTRHYMRFDKWNNPNFLSEDDKKIYKIFEPVILKAKTFSYILFKHKKLPKDLSLWIIKNYICLMV